MHDRFEWAKLGDRVILRTTQENLTLTEKPRLDKPVLHSVRTMAISIGIIIICTDNHIRIALEIDLDSDGNREVYDYKEFDRIELHDVTSEDTLELASNQPCVEELLTHWNSHIRRILQ